MSCRGKMSHISRNHGAHVPGFSPLARVLALGRLAFGAAEVARLPLVRRAEVWRLPLRSTARRDSRDRPSGPECQMKARRPQHEMDCVASCKFYTPLRPEGQTARGTSEVCKIKNLANFVVWHKFACSRRLRCREVGLQKQAKARVFVSPCHSLPLVELPRFGW